MHKATLQRTEYAQDRRPGRWRYIANGVAVVHCPKCGAGRYVGGELSPVRADGTVEGSVSCPDSRITGCDWVALVRLVGWTGC